MNNCKGFSLLEVMVALFVLTMVSLVVLPVLTIVYQERLTIKEEQYVLDSLDRIISNWQHDQTSTIEKNLSLDPNFTISLLARNSHELKVCITWVGKNDRVYERCENGRR